MGNISLAFDAPVLMSILNLTPDSFSDGGALPTVDAVLRRAEAQIEAGATLLDLGAESTRPGAKTLDARTELDRLMPALTSLARRGLAAVLSVDTQKASVADAALAAGATLINDVSALGDPAMAEVVARHRAAVVLMHKRGNPETMQAGPIHYDDLIGEVHAHLEDARARAILAGVGADRIFVDPGLGFGKNLEHNLSLTRHLGAFADLGPVVYGPSRKRFLGEITGRPVEDRDRATAAACALAVVAGASVLRVHDAAAVRDAVAVAAAVAHAE